MRIKAKPLQWKLSITTEENKRKKEMRDIQETENKIALAKCV